MTSATNTVVYTGGSYTHPYPYGGGSGGISTTTTVPMINYPLNVYGTTPIYSTAATFYPYFDPTMYTPNSEQLSTLGADALVDRMLTKVKKDDTVVICVDSDATNEQLREIADSIADKGIKGVVLRGARAGTGFPYKGLRPLSDEDKRVDILARIGELWATRPDLTLTDLLKWYSGEDMTDEAFAAAVEVHFTKVTNGISSST